MKGGKKMRISKVVTKTGDGGMTRLGDLSTVSKASDRVEAYGNVDEVNSIIGYCVALLDVSDIRNVLLDVQAQLFVVGSDLATPYPKNVPRVTPKMVEFLTEECERLNSKLAPLEEFILPGGCPAGAMLHVLRTVVRRAERCVVKLSEKEKVNPDVIRYLNRLSDLVFILARTANARGGTLETQINFRDIMQKYS